MEKCAFPLYFEVFSMLESKFQAWLIKNLQIRFPGCIVLKNDPNYIQGIPDLLILFNDKWATLEVKKDAHSSVRPNQQYYIDKMQGMSFASIVYPENVEEVLDALERTFYA